MFLKLTGREDHNCSDLARVERIEEELVLVGGVMFGKGNFQGSEEDPFILDVLNVQVEGQQAVSLDVERKI